MAEITSLSDLTGSSAPSLETIIALRDKLLVVQYNLLAGNGTYGGTDYEENGELGFTITVSTKLRELREAIKQLNSMIENPGLVTDDELGVYTMLFDNPLIVEVTDDGLIQ